MFRISAFSQLTRVSIKALRHYDRLGLLVPAFVDPQTGYRHYVARQAPRLYRIVALRELGFSLVHISEILEHDGVDEGLRNLLELRRTEVVHQLEIERRRLAQLEASLRELEDEHRGRLPDPVLRALPAVRIATRRARVVDLDDGPRRLFEAVEADAARAGIRVAGPPLLIYHDRDHREADADVEACVPIAANARAAGRSTTRTLAAVPAAACVIYTGGYEQWGEVARGLLAWLQRRRLVPAGPTRETFLQFSARGLESLDLPREFLADRGEDFVTEMQIPVRRARAVARRNRAAS